MLDFVASEAAAARLPVLATTVDETDQRRDLACAIRLLPAMSDASTRDPVGAALAAIDLLPSPSVILVDDLQWADAASAEVLAAVASRAEDLGVLLVTTARTQSGFRQLVEFDRAIDRRGVRLMLDPLTVDKIVELAQIELGAPPDAAFTELLLGASGNPFLTVELMRGLQRDGALSQDDGLMRVAPGSTLPSSLRERLAREALAASSHDSIMIRSAAAISGGFTAEEMASLIERPPIDVLNDLLALTDADVLRERDGRLVFRHDIIRQAVLEATPAPLVRSLNRRAAELLSTTGSDPTRVASCLLVAADISDARDVSALVDLGLSLRVDCPNAAADVLQRALQGLDRDDPRFVDVVLALGWVLADLGRLAEVSSVLQLLDDCDQGRLDVRRLRGYSLSLQGQLALEFAPLPEDFDIDAAFERVDVDAVDVVAELSTFEMITGRVERAQALVEWVKATGVPLGPIGEMYLGMTMGWLHAREGSYEAGLEVAERGMALAAASTERETSRVTPAIVAAIMLDCLGRGDDALRVLRVAQAAPGPKWLKPLLQFGSAVTLYRRGAWDDSLAEVGAGLAAADEFGIRIGTAWPHALQIMIATARGDTASAQGWLERARVEVPKGSLGTEWLMHASAVVAEADGDVQGALELLRPTVEVAIALGAPAVLLNLSPDAARVAMSLGDEKTVTIVVDNLAELAAKSRSPIVHANHAWASAWQRSEYALAERAGLAVAGCGRYADHVRAHHDAAVIAAATGFTTEARRLAGVAFAGYEALRAQQLHARLRAELRAHDVQMRPRRAPPRATTGWDALTDTERQIVDLVGDGLANGTIAERLFVSRRTVESHLARVYQKLGFARRAELVLGVREHNGNAPLPIEAG